MFDSEFAPGDPVRWFDDGHGRGLPADHPAAVRRSGVVSSVLRNPDGSGPAVGYFVRCYSTISGSYIATVRPDLGHVLALDERAS
ncbi:hypothetical protein [Nocardia brasiliensis]|uniref:Uncharacterized protein n=1 Tax=Nocardia brasiliensis (strain ATCC 700358 / HUJEG-1) TaxID=1133849 RepID=K0F5Z2_NOCB7|nr:hypothetical protein [Nocardia brasiliensis]AFU02886.1 hypothetical protein O3I_024665 [Nocardia brasiliensis ATCC 700358]OCF85964.1 hypothetical protein AW168_32890 [Nocardia brasiliensis]